MEVDINKLIKRYKKEAKLYENHIDVYSHVMGFIHVLEQIKEKQENKSDRLSVTVDCINADKFAEKLKEKDWLIDVLKESSKVKDRENKRLADKNEQLKIANEILRESVEGFPEVKERSTKELVDELKHREGVELKQIEPHEEYNLSYGKWVLKNTGPAKILIVTD